MLWICRKSLVMHCTCDLMDPTETHAARDGERSLSNEIGDFRMRN